MGDHDRLLSGRVRARFEPEALSMAAQALEAAKEAVFKAVGVDGGDLEHALDAWRLIRGLKQELVELVSASGS